MFYFKTIPVPVPLIWLTIISEFLPCVLLTLCFASMTFHVRRHDQSARTLAKQLRFNHQMSFKILHDRSAVIMMGLVIGVFLVCYGMHLTWRCVLKKIIKKTKAYHLTCVTHSCSIGCKSLMNECERLEQFSKRLINVWGLDPKRIEIWKKWRIRRENKNLWTLREYKIQGKGLRIKFHRWCETQVLIRWNFLVSHHESIILCSHRLLPKPALLHLLDFGILEQDSASIE